MNKKSLLGLILFACLVTAMLFLGASYLYSQGAQADTSKQQTYTKEDEAKNDNKGVVSSEETSKDASADQNNTADTEALVTLTPGATASMPGNIENALDISITEPWLSANPTDTDDSSINQSVTEETGTITEEPSDASAGTLAVSIDSFENPQLIKDKNKVDYEAYIPEMIYDSDLEVALDIDNPSIKVDAEAAILFDAKTKKVLYYKNPVLAKFSASTIKLLTSIVALKWCKVEDQVTIGDEVKLIASDSTKAGLIPGEVLTIQNLLDAMLLPSGNDAAYAVAAYVGRKSLADEKATREEAVAEFVRLMNEEAKLLGVKNSCFRTPDGYDAVGQYTTAYDMGLIGIEAANNATIIDVTQKSSGRNQFVSGEDVTWKNTDKLITRYSGQYYSHAIGLKTGTSSMAGRCLIAAAELGDKKVVCVILDSSLKGRWEDAIELLKYGLD